MRICIVTSTLSRTDGQGRINYETASYMAQKGHEVVLLSTILTSPLKDAPNVTWHEIPTPRWARGAFLKNLLFSRAAYKILRADPKGFDIVQVNGGNTLYPADVNVSMFVHSSWIKSPYHPARVRGGLYGAYQRFYTLKNVAWEIAAYRDANQVVALSELVRESLIADAQVAPQKINVLSPGVDATEFRPLRPGEANLLRAECRVPPDAFLLFFVGDIKSNRKNLDLALRSLTQLAPNVHLAVAGQEQGSPYPPMAQELGLAGRVHFLGKRADVSTLMRGADAFTFPSHYDTFALVVTEAMASGLPTITTPATGASCVIRHGENGFVLEDSADLEGMVRILRQLVADRDFAACIRAAARHTAESLSWEAMARCYEALYEEIGAQKKRADVSRAPKKTAGV